MCYATLSLQYRTLHRERWINIWLTFGLMIKNLTCALAEMGYLHPSPQSSSSTTSSRNSATTQTLTPAIWPKVWLLTEKSHVAKTYNLFLMEPTDCGAVSSRRAGIIVHQSHSLLCRSKIYIYIYIKNKYALLCRDTCPVNLCC